MADPLGYRGNAKGASERIIKNDPQTRLGYDYSNNQLNPMQGRNTKSMRSMQEINAKSTRSIQEIQPFYAKINPGLAGNRSVTQRQNPGYVIREIGLDMQRSLVLQDNWAKTPPVRRCSLTEILMPKLEGLAGSKTQRSVRVLPGKSTSILKSKSRE